jgi:hypothetical protein
MSDKAGGQAAQTGAEVSQPVRPSIETTTMSHEGLEQRSYVVVSENNATIATGPLTSPPPLTDRTPPPETTAQPQSQSE